MPIELSDGTRAFFDTAAPSAFPLELIRVTDEIKRAMQSYEDAPKTVDLYFNGNGESLGTDGFLGLFGHLFTSIGDSRTFKANTNEDATNLVVGFIVKFPLNAKQRLRQRLYTTMYAGFNAELCEWKSSTRELHERIAAMRDLKARDPPHVIVLIATWLNMVLAQSPSLKEAQRIFLILHLMRFDRCLKAQGGQISVKRHFIEGDGGERLLIDTKVDPQTRILCVGVLRHGNVGNRPPGEVANGVTIKLTSTHRVTARDCDGGVVEVREATVFGDDSGEDEAGTSEERPFTYSTASHVAEQLLTAGSGVFANDVMQSKRHMWQSFFGNLYVKGRFTSQALLAARNACASLRGS